MSKKEKIQFDDDIIRQIDKEMGWIERDGSSPSKTANKLGYSCKFIEGPFSGTAWHKDGLWSVCILSGNKTTLLAKSFSALEVLYKKNIQRKTSKKWLKYYSKMWKKRYKKWVCKSPSICDCQLCRMGCKKLTNLSNGIENE